MRIICDLSFMSHPVWVRGLKRFGKFKNALAELSHPVWVRGLKLTRELETMGILDKSHPVWVRGLKPKPY